VGSHLSYCAGNTFDEASSAFARFRGLLESFDGKLASPDVRLMAGDSGSGPGMFSCPDFRGAFVESSLVTCLDSCSCPRGAYCVRASFVLSFVLAVDGEEP